LRRTANNSDPSPLADGVSARNQPARSNVKKTQWPNEREQTCEEQGEAEVDKVRVDHSRTDRDNQETSRHDEHGYAAGGDSQPTKRIEERERPGQDQRKARDKQNRF